MRNREAWIPTTLNPKLDVNQAWRRIRQDKQTLAGILIVLAAILISLLAPWISPYDPNAGDGALRLSPPGTPGHLLGLDDQGRDILSRLIWGSRYSLLAALLPITIAFVISIWLGLTAGFVQGRIGELIMRILDVLFAFPMILFAIAIAAILGPGVMTILVTITVALIPYMSRVVFASVKEEKGKEYIEAARMLGASTTSILFRELLPNVISPLIVYATTLVGSMIVFSSGLSFLGLGIQPPDSDWGRMTGDGMKVLTQGAPHVATIPGLLIMLVSLGFNWLGDGLRDWLDPYKRMK
ncbi:ABC transporter permease [Paenibacillus validus]|uniref:ABC transporter permease subunit n=1 Tax=Paenibacillus validus TaxID=44253 RepID=A0A7X2ZEN6_9BACL|nr:ABC transporter permease [Paenibacillus validus]MED4601160.1 ABC transporter permease [Paenibacillus validus]MED4606872.1 ABC transporter permease [Paenibacillus validus]MUG72766.1 ABC transporter permease subunit [Paenibacillus validus]